MHANGTLLDWVLERLGVLIFVLIFVVQIVRGLLRQRQSAPEPEETKPDALEEERRVREIQETIRRRIAERRGEAPPAAEPPPMMRREAAPEPGPETTQMPDPFGGPLRRVLEELQRQARPQPEPPPPLPPVIDQRSQEMERQRKLAEELQALEEARALAKKRAARVAAGVAEEARSETGQRHAARDRALDDLRNPESLRRAIVLREVLGTPVGLR